MLHKIIFILLFVITLNSTAQKHPQIKGDWLLSKTTNKNTSQNLRQLVTFNQDGKLLIQNIPFGTWQYDKKENLLIIKAKKISGNYKLNQQSATEMQLIKKDKSLFFSKINLKQIHKDNANSGLIGLWEFKINNEIQTHRIVTFKAPDKISLIEKDTGIESRYSGIWLYQNKEKQLVIIGQMKGIRGINTKVNITTNEVNFLNNTKPVNLTKVKQVVSIEHLNFTEDDFYTKDGDYKYEDEAQKLPWTDYYQMIDDLSNVSHLVYKRASLVTGTKSFENKILKADVTANLNEEILEIDNIFNGFDRYNLPDDTQLKPNKYNQYASKLYPYEDITYRVINTTEKITVPAGTFTCTVVEGISNFEEKIKIWMVNDKPGIIAKIIKEQSDDFGHYIIYTLQKIVLK